MICLEINKSELLFGISVSYKLRKYGFTQFEGQINVHKSQIVESIVAECYPTERDLLTMNFDKIKKELKR
jgi:hypothetical protein